MLAPDPSFAIPPHLVYWAIERGDAAALDSYLKQGTDLSARNEADNTPLHFALVHNKPEFALRIIAAGAPLNARGHNARTPLMLALMFGANGVAQALLEKGADMAPRDAHNKSALNIAQAQGNTGGVQLLFAHMDEKELHENALWAIRGKDLDSLRYMVEKLGVRLSVPGPGGDVPAADMTLWEGGPVADYVAQAVANETAREAARGLTRPVNAPKAAKFRQPAGPRHG